MKRGKNLTSGLGNFLRFGDGTGEVSEQSSTMELKTITITIYVLKLQSSSIAKPKCELYAIIEIHDHHVKTRHHACLLNMKTVE